MTVLILVVLAVALVGGLGANLWWRRRTGKTDSDGCVSPKDLLGPVLTLTVLILAFILVQASSSYNTARDASRAEANALDHMYEVAAYVPQPERQRIEADLVCYSRAVVHHEWDMSDGTLSPIPSLWSTDVRRAFAGVAKSESPAFGMLVSADKERATERGKRVDESKAKTPNPVYWLVLLALVIALVGYALEIPLTRNAAQISTMIAVTILFALVLLLIRDLEQPFTGLVTVESDPVAQISNQLARDFANANPGARLPCDDTGRRIG
ncbi:DUF4239 domain-containing protein [Actinomadura sp. 1N219]|uniref:bestrophin-like domain n=1 Tax=Actinomadura sp. 1N219 TaxID=3375152 RepID=UPI0037ACB6BA